MTGEARYDTIGHGYASGRHPDHRLRKEMLDALGSSVTVLNVGAGTGNYEPIDRPTIALEPSAVMIASCVLQRTVAARDALAHRRILPSNSLDVDQQGRAA